jgi:hypothetical protein
MTKEMLLPNNAMEPTPPATAARHCGGVGGAAVQPRRVVEDRDVGGVGGAAHRQPLGAYQRPTTHRKHIVRALQDWHLVLDHGIDAGIY